ncbi:cadmium resistance transporter [Novosphingobium sp.]|uniref:cadmium resistance transporter n=1 Tax=Novosphingobium sp. TaxID=1874826 RepID=UPI0025F39B7B|nr:cadmium resistance transporter [Novosphingobium sp.]
MSFNVAALALGISVFATTNVDDVFLLTAFFADPKLRRLAIIIGQFAGIALLTAVSIGAALLAINIRPEWTALLGLVPLALGFKKLSALRSGEDQADPTIAQERTAQERLHSQVLAVGVVTIANGGDNLGVCIPIMATSPSVIPSFIAVFIAMTGLWCLIGFLLVRNPMSGGQVRRWGHIVLPLVLIGIGLHILSGARGLIG